MLITIVCVFCVRFLHIVHERFVTTLTRPLINPSTDLFYPVLFHSTSWLVPGAVAVVEDEPVISAAVVVVIIRIASRLMQQLRGLFEKGIWRMRVSPVSRMFGMRWSGFAFDECRRCLTDLTA